MSCKKNAMEWRSVRCNHTDPGACACGGGDYGPDECGRCGTRFEDGDMTLFADYNATPWLDDNEEGCEHRMIVWHVECPESAGESNG